jgi:pimeloyl-ACP methyl ester carboxylesterase
VKKAFKRSIAAVASLAATIGLSLPAAAQSAPAGSIKGESVAYPLRGAIAPPSVGDVDTSQVHTVPVPDKAVKTDRPSENNCFFGGPIIRKNDLAGLAGFAAAVIAFIAFLRLLRKHPAMWIIGISMGGLFAALGYLWSTRM